MTAAKRIYLRKDLETQHREPGGYVIAVCSLCYGRSLETVEKLYPEDHEVDCPMADPEVEAVEIAVRTKPRGDICDECPASSGRGCVVDDWSLEYHEVLQTKCSRYTVEDI